MGEIRKITCKSCGRDWQVQTGCGLQHGRLENIVPAFPEMMGKGIMNSVADMEFPLYDFAYHPAHCEYCCRIVDVPVFTPMGKPGFIGVCPICGREAALIWDVAKAVCPVCGKKTLREEETGFWD